MGHFKKMVKEGSTPSRNTGWAEPVGGANPPDGPGRAALTRNGLSVPVPSSEMLRILSELDVLQKRGRSMSPTKYMFGKSFMNGGEKAKTRVLVQTPTNDPESQKLGLLPFQTVSAAPTGSP